MIGEKLIADLVRNSRKKKKKSLRQLGKSKGINANHVSDIENCRKGIPRWESIRKIVIALDGDVEQARAYHTLAIAIQSLENIELTNLSEREFMKTFIIFVTQVFSDFDINIAKELKDSKGRYWDIAFDFKQVKKEK